MMQQSLLPILVAVVGLLSATDHLISPMVWITLGIYAVLSTVVLLRSDQRQREQCYYALTDRKLWLADALGVPLLPLSQVENIDLITRKQEGGIITLVLHGTPTEAQERWADFSQERQKWIIVLDEIDHAYPTRQLIRQQQILA